MPSRPARPRLHGVGGRAGRRRAGRTGREGDARLEYVGEVPGPANVIRRSVLLGRHESLDHGLIPAFDGAGRPIRLDIGFYARSVRWPTPARTADPFPGRTGAPGTNVGAAGFRPPPHPRDGAVLRASALTRCARPSPRPWRDPGAVPPGPPGVTPGAARGLARPVRPGGLGPAVHGAFLLDS